MSALLSTIYVGELRTERKVASWHRTSEILIAAVTFNLSMKQIVVHLGAETENAEEKEANLSEALPYIVILI